MKTIQTAKTIQQESHPLVRYNRTLTDEAANPDPHEAFLVRKSENLERTVEESDAACAILTEPCLMNRDVISSAWAWIRIIRLGF
jgi:hypothetical protein